MKRLEQLLGFLTANPGDSFITFALAKEYEKLGKADKALTRYRDIETQDPDYVGLYYHLGKLYEAKGESDKALLTYEKGMAVAKKVGDQHAFNELEGAKNIMSEF